MDMAALVEGLQATKARFNTLGTAPGLVKDMQGVMPAGEKKDAVVAPLNEAEKQIHVATAQIAQIAQGFGYQLCQCNYTPAPMLEVSEYFQNPASISLPHFPQQRVRRVIVYECPRCNRHDGPQNYGEWRRAVLQSNA